MPTANGFRAPPFRYALYPPTSSFYPTNWAFSRSFLKSGHVRDAPAQKRRDVQTPPVRTPNGTHRVQSKPAIRGLVFFPSVDPC
jgi:hypothetical protein